MALNYVTLILDLADGTGVPRAGGTALLAPSAQLTDTADDLLITQAPVQAPFMGGGFPQVKLLATDNGALAPSGWAWTVSFPGVPGSPAPFSFFLPYAGGATQYLSGLSPVSGVTTMAAYLPIQYSHGAAAGYVWTSDANGNGSWEPGGGGAVSSVFGRTGAVLATSGDYSVGQVTGAAPLASPALTGTPTAPTQTTGDNSTKIATDQFVATAVGTETTRAEAAEALLIPLAQRGAASGVATLDSGTHVPAAQLPAATSSAQGAVELTGDLGGTATSPQVVSTHLASALPVNQGGTGSTTRNFAGLLTPAAVKTSAYTASAGDFVPCDTTSGSFTVTLPNAPADLSVVGVKQVIQGGTNTVTIACSGSDVFNKASGATTATLTLLAQGLLLQYKASSAIWYVLADDLPLTQLDSRYVASVTAADTSVVVGGTASAPTVRTATLDVIAADHPPAANWSNNSHKITSLANGSAASDAAALGQVVNSISATDTSIVITGGSGTTPTIATGTLDVIAADHPAAADWSNNSHKITSVANGSGAQDAAAYGQTPARGDTATIGQGGTGQVTQQAAMDALAGAATSGNYLRGNGSHVVMSAIQAGDVPDLAYVDSVSAADSSVTVTGAADTPAIASVPAQYAQRIFAV